MRICVYGAGAIGGYLGALLERAGSAEVTLIARGPHLQAMQEHGLTLRMAGEEIVTHSRCVEEPAEAGEQDFVVIALKSHSVPAILDRIDPLLGPDTAIVTALNGIPWWYFHASGPPHEGRHLDSVDPGGRQWAAFGPRRAIGCAPWPSCEVVEPGVVQHEFGDRMALGEPDGTSTERLEALSAAFREAGLRAPAVRDIRAEIWVKLLGNLAFNPISALTGATLVGIAEDAELRGVVAAMMEEGRSVAAALDVRIAMSTEKRIDAAAEVGPHKTSMLQDLERGRPLEIEALVGSVAELGRLTGVATPTIDTVYALITQRAREAAGG